MKQLQGICGRAVTTSLDYEAHAVPQKELGGCFICIWWHRVCVDPQTSCRPRLKQKDTLTFTCKISSQQKIKTYLHGFCICAPNGVRYPLVGGMVESPPKRKNPKLEKGSKNAARTHRQLHAVLATGLFFSKPI